MTFCRLSLVCCLTALALPAQSDARHALRRAFRPTEEVRALVGERMAAIGAAAKGDGTAEIVEDLVAAWMRCHAEALPIERRMAEKIESGGARLAAGARGDFDALLRPMVAIENALRGFSARPAIDRLVELAVLGNDLDPRLRVRVCYRLNAASGELREEAARELLRARRPDDVWILIRALAATRLTSETVAELEERMEDRSELVRLEAVRALGRSKVRPAAEALIVQLQDAEGRMHRALLAALRQLTGRDLGPVPESWLHWWRVEGEAFVAGNAPAPKRKGDGAEVRTSSGFFGLPQDGRSILYVIDRSLSMRVAMARQRGAAKRGEESRWDRLVTELKAALGRLDERQTFNIVAFGDRNITWERGMQPATERNLEAAGRWIDGLKLELGTHVFGAFDEAFDLVGPRLSDRYFDPAVDTMMFLSDGHPTVRNPSAPRKLQRDDAGLVLALVRRRNPFGSVLVHAVALGRGSRSRFLENLAAQNGGRFVHVK